MENAFSHREGKVGRESSWRWSGNRLSTCLCPTISTAPALSQARKIRHKLAGKGCLAVETGRVPP